MRGNDERRIKEILGIIDLFLFRDRIWRWLDLWYIVSLLLFLVPFLMYIYGVNSDICSYCVLLDFFVLYSCGLSLVCAGLSHYRYYAVLCMDSRRADVVRRYRKWFHIIGMLTFAGCMIVFVMAVFVLFLM